MLLEPLHAARFGRESPVATYWVTRCEGFRVVVGRREVGTVERAIVDDDPLAPVALRIRRTRGRTKLISLSELDAVEPFSRVLYFGRRRRTGHTAAERRLAATATQVQRGASAALAAAIVICSAAVSTAIRYWPAVRRAFRVTARIALATVAYFLKLAFAGLAVTTRLLLELARTAAARSRPLVARRLP